jgi:multiple sugar transport system ATP-binding protein
VAQVALENLCKSYPARREEGRVNVLQHINLTVQDGEFLVLVGPSGCGKSTLLRLLAGLDAPTSGRIVVGDRPVNDLPPKERDIAMVFQNYALYPHLSVYDNLAFGLRRMQQPQGGSTKQQLQRWLQASLVGLSRSLPQALRLQTPQERAIRERVEGVARMLQLETLLDRLPKQLSGGQKQRVALGRAIARNPQVFLMDEPLSNLDAKLRAATRSQIVALQKELGITTLYVTHDQVEAMTMGDRIAVLNGGQIQQIGTPLELYQHPANRFVAAFLGTPPMNFVPVTVKAPSQITRGEFRLTLPANWSQVLQAYDGRDLLLGIRPEQFSLAVPAAKNLPVTVKLVEALGSDTYLICELAGLSEPINVRIEPTDTVRSGDTVWLGLKPEFLHFFDPYSERAIAPTPPRNAIRLPFSDPSPSPNS